MTSDFSRDPRLRHGLSRLKSLLQDRKDSFAISPGQLHTQMIDRMLDHHTFELREYRRHFALPSVETEFNAGQWRNRWLSPEEATEPPTTA